MSCVHGIGHGLAALVDHNSTEVRAEVDERERGGEAQGNGIVSRLSVSIDAGWPGPLSCFCCLRHIDAASYKPSPVHPEIAGGHAGSAHCVQL